MNFFTLENSNQVCANRFFFSILIINVSGAQLAKTCNSAVFTDLVITFCDSMGGVGVERRREGLKKRKLLSFQIGPH